MSNNTYQAYPPGYRPVWRPAAAITQAADDTITLAVKESEEWSYEEHSYTSGTIRPVLERLAQHDAIIYAATRDARPIISILHHSGIAESVLSDRRDGGCYIKDRDTGQPIGLLIPGLPPIWFWKLPQGMRPKDQAGEVFGFLWWAFTQRVPAGEPAQMTFNLWKITWPTGGYKTWFYEEQRQGRPPKSLYVVGGRTDPEWQLMLHGWDLSIPGHYQHATLLDCKMAYPYVMAHDTLIERDGLFPMHLYAAKDGRLPEPWEFGISRIVVHGMPDMQWPPLPYYNPESGKWEPLREPHADLTVTNRELWQALRHGVDLEIKESYVGVKGTYRQPFAKWYDLYREARELKPGATFAKWIFTRLWGQLSKEGHKDNFDFLPWSLDIAARLRVKVHEEVLGRPEVGAVYVETDGVIVTGELPAPYECGPGSWCVKPGDGPVNAAAWIPDQPSTVAYTYESGRPGFRGEHGKKKLADYVMDLCERQFASDPEWQEWKRRVGR